MPFRPCGSIAHVRMGTPNVAKPPYENYFALYIAPAKGYFFLFYTPLLGPPSSLHAEAHPGRPKGDPHLVGRTFLDRPIGVHICPGHAGGRPLWPRSYAAHRGPNTGKGANPAPRALPFWRGVEGILTSLSVPWSAKRWRRVVLQPRKGGV